VKIVPNITMHGVRRSAMAAVAAVSLLGLRAGAQLAPKTSLASTGPSGCAAYPIAPATGLPASSDDAEARRLIADAQEAALQGEHAAARDAFIKAAQRAPANARIAYYLGREHEALSEATEAVRQYCRYLNLAPTAPDGDEVRGRIVRLVPGSELSRVDEARANFHSGVALLERRQYVGADSMFGAIIRQLPNAAEAYFNRGLVRAARGARAPALEDFEKYLELSPAASDRVTLRAAMARFPDRVYVPAQAFTSGIIPGMGQMSTGRPLFGVAVLGAVGGAFAFGMTQHQTVEVRTFTDPFGNTYTDSLPKTGRPYFAAAAAGAAVVWIAAAFEAQHFARRSRERAESIIQRPGNHPQPARGSRQPRTGPLTSAPRVQPFVRAWPAHGVQLGVSLAVRGSAAPR
jgi:tetratricopeptide (TPR) repeat protein